MAYFETARMVSAAVYTPDTWVEYLALPERDDVGCQVCGNMIVIIYRDVVTCKCGERWRWPPIGGMG